MAQILCEDGLYLYAIGLIDELKSDEAVQEAPGRAKVHQLRPAFLRGTVTSEHGPK